MSARENITCDDNRIEKGQDRDRPKNQGERLLRMISLLYNS